MKILITGGAGFIGSAVIRFLHSQTDFKIINVDKLTYAGNVHSLPTITDSERYIHEKVDICDSTSLDRVFEKHVPTCVMHLAAESHVDRSITGPTEFVNTNIVGTFNLLTSATNYFKNLSQQKKNLFKFHHISTDEVYGDLRHSRELFTETTPYSPSSPYAASKAASDHLVRAWWRTYNLPVLITNCSNNYGPFQFPEKLIPNVILNAIQGSQISLYGNGLQTRDWLFVEDHARALIKVLTEGEVGQTFNIGGHNEKTNLEVVEMICEILDGSACAKPNAIHSFKDLITFIKDRPGHDVRYAVDASKIKSELEWVPKESFETGLQKTVHWYLENHEWLSGVLSGDYKLERLGS